MVIGYTVMNPLNYTDENGEEIDVQNIEDDEEFDIVADAFDELLDEEEFDNLMGDEEDEEA